VSAIGLREVLQETNEKDDLPLGSIRKSIPLLRWRASIRRESTSIESHRPGEVDSVGLDNVSNKSSHGNATMFDLSLTQESNCSVVAVSPDRSIGQLKRVVVLHDKIETYVC
jgi:hypothetical protein